MSKQFEADKNEYFLIDNYPSKKQRAYGRPDPADLKIYYQPIGLEEHLKRIHGVYKGESKTETKIRKPKVVDNITANDKKKITHTDLI